MNKIELYNKIVDITRETGQGCSGILGKMDNSIQILLDELESDGMVDVYKQGYSYLPDDIFYFPKGCFSIFSNPDKQSQSKLLTFVRVYLGIDNLGLGLSRMNFLLDPKNEKSKLEYESWVFENSIELDKMKNYPYYGEDVNNVVINNTDLNDEYYNFIKDRDWYKKNLTIKECQKLCEDGYKNDISNINLSERIIELVNLKSNKIKDDIDDIDNMLSDIVKSKKDNELRSIFLLWSKSQNIDEKIKNIIK